MEHEIDSDPNTSNEFTLIILGESIRQPYSHEGSIKARDGLLIEFTSPLLI